MARTKPPEKRMLSLAPFGDADLRQPETAAEEETTKVVYEGLTGNIAGLGNVAHGDELTLPHALARDLVARKRFRRAS